MTLGERIRKLRRSLDLTQQEFAGRIGTTQNALTGYETSRRNPSGSVVNNICKTFNVNEAWLRSGEGEMFVQQSKGDEIAAFVEGVLTDETADFKRRFIAALSKLSPEGWNALEQLVEDISSQHSADVPVDQDAIWEAEARAEAEDYYRQILAEKERASQASFVSGSDAG